MKAAGHWAAGRATGTAGTILPPPMCAARACCSSRRTWAIGNSRGRVSQIVQHGCKLVVLTQPEPDPRLTEMRQNSRARLRGDRQTLVVGEDMFAFVEIIRRLQEGATVALLVDRPPAPTAVNVELFSKPFPRLQRGGRTRAGFRERDCSSLYRPSTRPLSRAHPAGNRL